jgi:ribonuclease T2
MMRLLEINRLYGVTRVGRTVVQFLVFSGKSNSHIGAISRLLKPLLLLACALNAASRPALAQRSGEFDYYIVSLSWSPSWCAADASRDNAEQCDPDKDFGFIMHGLWPQYERGWPSFCKTTARDPSRRQTREMEDIMGSSGLAWHQWKKHGRCTGLTAKDYYKITRRAFESISRPQILRDIDEVLRLDPSVVEEAFLEANPELHRDGITITCKNATMQEARICLTKDLEPRKCGRDARKDCGVSSMNFPPIR